MDIDLLWVIGGWFLIPDCMATLKISIPESSSKSHPFLLFLGLIFIFLVLVNSSDDPSNSNPAMVSKFSAQSLVPDASSSASSATVNLHPGRSQNSRKHSSPPSTSREFEAAKHAVPSGPNPISN